MYLIYTPVIHCVVQHICTTSIPQVKKPKKTESTSISMLWSSVFAYYCVLLCSSLSVWVHNCDDLDLSSEDREKLDGVIDKLYDDLDRGKSMFKILGIILKN